MPTAEKGEVLLLPERFSDKERSTVNLAKTLFELVRTFDHGRLQMKEVFEQAVRLWLTIYANMLRRQGQDAPALVRSDVGHDLSVLAVTQGISEPLLVRAGAELLVALHGEIGVHKDTVYADIAEVARRSGVDFTKEVATRLRASVLLDTICPGAGTARSSDDLTKKLRTVKLKERT